MPRYAFHILIALAFCAILVNIALLMVYLNLEPVSERSANTSAFNLPSVFDSPDIRVEQGLANQNNASASTVDATDLESDDELNDVDATYDAESSEELSESDDEQLAQQGERFEQCDLAWSMDRVMPSETLGVINRFMPAGVEVHCAFQQEMADEESEATVVLVVYGTKKGCPDNCYANNLCAIADSSGFHLYSSSWHEYEYSPSLYQVCDVMDNEPDGSTLLHCEEQPSGFYHPIVFSKDFKRYNEPFRFCFRSLL